MIIDWFTGIMDNPWIYLILMILTGAWTGYITNDVAIKMLFRQYGFGRFKLGGVIINSRGKLEKNLADLVEQEIINHNTLRSQLHKPEVKEAISKIVVTFFNDAIYKHSQDMRINELPGFEDTINKSIAFLEEYLKENLGAFLIEISREVELSDIISSEQAFTIADRLTKELVAIIQKEEVLKPFLSNLFHTYKEVTVGELLGDEIIHIIAHNIGDVLNTIFEEMRFKYDKEISTFIHKLYRDLDLESLVDRLEQFLSEKPVSYYISETTLHELYNMLRNYLDENDSKESIEVFCEGLMVALKKIDKPIIELFTGDIRLEVEKFLETQLPGIIDRLIEIVQRNSHEIEELIESSIDQTIYDQQTIKRIILQAIRIFLIENFTQKYDIINKIVELLRGVDIENLSRTISEQVVDILHQKSVSSIIDELEANKILTPRLIASQVHRVLSFLLERYLSSDIDHSDFLNKQLGEVITLNLKPFINNLTVTVLTKQLLYNEQLFQFVKNKVAEKVVEFKDVPVQSLVTEERFVSFSETLENLVRNYTQVHQSEINDYIFRHMLTYLEENKLSTLVKNDNLQLTNETIVELIIRSIENVIKDKTDIYIHEIFDKITSVDHLSDNVVESIMNFLDSSLSKVLEGNVSRVVENNLKKLSNEEILELMQDFMGRNLGPLTTLGAVLGGIVGVVLGFLTEPGATSYMINIPVYAILGYLTNVLAIWFIFRPYKPIFGIKATQGIIPRHIPVLASSLGRIVAEDLLSQESIDYMMQKDETQLKEGIKSGVKKDRYQVLKSFFINQNGRLSSEVNNAVVKQIKENNTMLAVRFTEDILKLDLNKIRTEILVEVISNLLSDRISNSHESMSTFLLNMFKSSRKIGDLSLAFNQTNADRVVKTYVNKELDYAIEILDDQYFLVRIIEQNKEQLNKAIQRPLYEVLPDSTKLGIQNFLYQIISNYLFAQDKQRSLSNYIFNEITTILQNNDSIDEMFGGRFFELINFNMETILERIEDGVINWLNENKYEINETVTRRAYEELTVMQQVGYKAVNGDKLIQDTVFRIVEEKLPDFVRRKMDNLHEEFVIFFENLGKIKLKDANIELQKEELQNYLSNVFSSKEIEVKTLRFIEGVLDHFLQLDTSKVFELLQINSVDDIIRRYKDAIVLVNIGLKESLSFRQEKVAEDIALIINRFITREIFQSRVRNITLGITEEQVLMASHNILKLLSRNDFLYNELYKIVDLGVSHFKTVPIDQILDEYYLSQDLKRLIDKVAINRNIHNILTKNIESLFGKTIESFDELVHDDLKNRVLDDLINAGYEVFMLHLSDLLQAVDFREVTEREINAMDARQIKELFDRVAKKYFIKLKLYGLYGGIFAFEMITFLSFFFRVGQRLVKRNEKEKTDEK